MSKKYLYLFSEGNATMRELLGGKGANLAEMTHIGLPVPQGFTISTEACTQYYEDGRQINDEIQAQIMEYIAKMEDINGKKFGDLKNPLLVSVRSGARASMPGMMDTILNLGLNDEVVAAMIAGNDDPKFARFVYDSYRRFIQMYSDVVMEVGKKYFEQLIDEMKEKKGVTYDVDLTADDLKELASQFKAEYKSKIGTDFPSDPKEQLMGAIKAVFRSWDNPRANVYRRDNDIPYSWGTAVNVMPMVFGNLNNNSGHRAKTWWQAFVLPCPSHRWRNSSRKLTTSLSRSVNCWRITTATCRIWSLQWKTENCICCSAATANARPRQHFVLPAIWLMKECVPKRKLFP